MCVCVCCVVKLQGVCGILDNCVGREEENRVLSNILFFNIQYVFLALRVSEAGLGVVTA